METRATIPITKIDDDQRIFGGWAYIAVTKTGDPVEDHSGDVIDTPEAWAALKDAFIRYALESRQGDDMHATFGVAKLAELFISDPERWEQVGIPAGTLPQGVFLTFKADDTPDGERLWQRIKTGELSALSIVGAGRREPIE
jgi:hypothetical protein